MDPIYILNFNSLIHNEAVLRLLPQFESGGYHHFVETSTTTAETPRGEFVRPPRNFEGGCTTTARFIFHKNCNRERILWT